MSDACNLRSTVMSLMEGKGSASSLERLDDAMMKELHNRDYKNVRLMLRAVNHLLKQDPHAVQTLLSHGLLMMLEELQEHRNPPKASLKIVEVFYEVSTDLCRFPFADSLKILDVFLLRFGAVVLDKKVPFFLRIEGIRTVNSLLDNCSKDVRKTLCQSEQHASLMESLANSLIDIGDYEMQVAISEALCRMTPKKLRSVFAGKWFSFRSFASAFSAIRDKDFETDCRIFLNELNDYYGTSRRVFSFPCISMFLDSTELFKPEDDLLKEFWVDFNMGTSSISFFVNDPQTTLWEIIHLSRDDVKSYDLRESDDNKILRVEMAAPLCWGQIAGTTIQITFDSKHAVEVALLPVFAENVPSSQDSQSDQNATLAEDSTLEHLELLQMFASSPAEEKLVPPEVFLQDSPSQRGGRGRKRTGSSVTDVFCFQDEPSDSEVCITWCERDSYEEESGKFAYRKTKIVRFMRALWNYQVKRAKAVMFGQSSLSNGSTKSLPDSISKAPVKKKMRLVCSDEELQKREKPRADYTRKKTRVKGRLKVLPLSSASSGEESALKHSTPKQKGQEGMIIPGRKLDSKPDWPVGDDVSQTRFMADSGFPDVSGSPLESCDHAEEVSLHGRVSERAGLGRPRPLHFLSGSPQQHAAGEASHGADEEESEEEMGSGVKAAFTVFKTQLRSYFSSRYQKMERRSLSSLTDCQRSVSVLLGRVHQQRLVHLERFQETVVQQVELLEQDCRSLRDIEQDIVSFWQSESNAVQAFCTKQKERLDVLGIPDESSSSR